MSILTRNKKVTVGVGVAAAAAAAIALGTGTYAAWTDVQSGAGGTFSAQSFALTVGSDTPAELFTVSDIYPGQEFKQKEITFTNKSNLAATLTGTETYTGDDYLADQLYQASSCTVSDAKAATGSPATKINSVGSSVLGPKGIVLNPNAIADCTFTFTFPKETATNNSEGKKMTVTSKMTLTQN